jgi:hypothetical protein
VSKRRKGGRPPGADRTRQPRARQRRRDIFVPRPFAGLADEPQWVALRELVPAATAPLTLAPSLVERHGERRVTLATLLPMAWPAMVRQDGELLVGLQRYLESGDANWDVAAAILAALDTEPGQPVEVSTEPGEGPRLAEVIVDGELEVSVRDGFEFWADGDATDPAVTASLDRANESIYPTVRMAAARAAYWCRVSVGGRGPGAAEGGRGSGAAQRAHLRWVLAEPEDTALAALSRLAAAGALKLRDDTKFAGMFRTQGLLAPVWDLPHESEADEWEEPLAALAKRYTDALAVEGGLDAGARRARQGLVGRQLNLR